MLANRLERHRDGRCWRRRGNSGGQGGMNGDEPVEPVEAEHPPDGPGGDRQPQPRAAGGGALVGARHGGRALVIARSSPSHVYDQLGGAAVDDPQQLFADLAGIAVADVLRKSQDREPSGPLHRVALRHGAGLGAHGAAPGGTAIATASVASCLAIYASPSRAAVSGLVLLHLAAGQMPRLDGRSRSPAPYHDLTMRRRTAASPKLG